MQRFTITEEELSWFFESEPDRANQDPIWFFDDSVYKVEVNGTSLSFAIQPYMKDIRLILSFKNIPIYEFNAMGVQDVLYSSGCTNDSLSIDISNNENIEIILKPSISIQHHYKVLE